MGKQGAADVVRTIGLYNDPAVQAYVSKVGLTLAKQTPRPDLPWQYQVVDDPAVNAFALPGGYIFVTRGMLTHMTNQAQLATVLGHESGHVAAKHSVQQMSQQEVASLGLAVGMALSPDVRKYGQLASAGMQLLFLKYSRDDETQADQLGFKYALADGYDVRQMVPMFQMLNGLETLSGAGRLPEWESTHPNPDNRIADVQNMLAKNTVNLDGKIVGQSAYLKLIDGMVYGADPRQGYFEGTTFLEPDLKFQFQFPTGWMTQNSADAVVAASKDQDALIELRVVPGSASDASKAFFASQGVAQAGSASSGNVHGLAALQGGFTAQTSGQVAIKGLATFIEYGGNTYQVLAYSPTDKFAGYEPQFSGSSSSFDKLTDPNALNVKPMRLRLETIPKAMTLEQFYSQYPSTVSIDEIALINGVQKGATLQAGQTVKRVVK
jgi:predicted Zn-dependent protease